MPHLVRINTLFCLINWTAFSPKEERVSLWHDFCSWEWRFPSRQLLVYIPLYSVKIYGILSFYLLFSWSFDPVDQILLFPEFSTCLLPFYGLSSQTVRPTTSVSHELKWRQPQHLDSSPTAHPRRGPRAGRMRRRTEVQAAEASPPSQRLRNSWRERRLTVAKLRFVEI